MRKPRHVRVVEKVLKWYQNPENFGKPLKRAAYELGYTADYIYQCISQYGPERFHEERRKIYHELLDEAANLAMAKLHEMLMSDDPEKVRFAMKEIREWVKIVQGEKVDIRNRYEGEVQLKIVHEVIQNEITQTDVVPETEGDTE